MSAKADWAGRKRRGLTVVAAIAAVAVAAALLGCGTIRRAARAAGVLSEVASEADPDATPVLETEVTFASAAGPTAGTLYRVDSPDAVTPGIVLSHGAAEAGFRDSRLVRLARALARAGFVVLAPDLVELRTLRIDPRSVDRIAGAALYLGSRRDLVGENKASLAGISFAGSFSLLAATRDDVRDEVSAVLAFGAYRDLESLIRYWLEAPPPEAEVEGVYPIASYGRWIALLNHLDDLAPPEDRAALRSTLEALLRGESAPPPPDSLTPRGAMLHRAARSPGPLPDSLAEDVLAAARPRLAPLEVAGRLGPLRAPVFLLHAEGDQLIPESESVAIASEIESADTVRVRLLVSDVFRHVDVGPADGVGLLDVLPEIFFLADFFEAAGL